MIDPTSESDSIQEWGNEDRGPGYESLMKEEVRTERLDWKGISYERLASDLSLESASMTVKLFTPRKRVEFHTEKTDHISFSFEDGELPFWQWKEERSRMRTEVGLGYGWICSPVRVEVSSQSDEGKVLSSRIWKRFSRGDLVGSNPTEPGSWMSKWEI